MKVSIIGGGGLVGSCAAYALQCGGIVREIALLDVNANLAAGHALDLMHGSPSIADQLLTSGGYEHVPDSDVICITAGLRRKPEESRLDLINRNTDLCFDLDRDPKSWRQEVCDCVGGIQSCGYFDIGCSRQTGLADLSSSRTWNPARYDPLLLIDR